MRSENQNVYTVAQVNAYIKNLLTRDFALRQIYVRGEVSNCKYHTSGHIYFTLKDGTGTIAAVMFAGNRNGLRFVMHEGQQVVVMGSISVYERDGRYQMYAKEIRLDGQGDLYQQLEERKRRLEEMGMFSAEYKQPIPPFARTIGIVTASTGAAIRDIVNIAHRRNPYVQLILYPAIVQGDQAVPSIIRGIETLDQMELDCLIVGRGGGSIEDLWAFNEEAVARAIFDCSTPIISAVGHETDTTIADYVADLRAPTPSAAAELAVFDWQAFQESMASSGQRLNRAMQAGISREKLRWMTLHRRLERLNPANQLEEKRQGLINREKQLSDLMQGLLEKRKHELALASARLEALSPLARMQTGYAFVSSEEGKSLHSISQINEGDLVKIDWPDGTAEAKILRMISRKSENNMEE
ncbi:MAG: exodeoxyribonuclease VII large subunit [Clostridiales bacterium]|nr:exodeoxyribonuclease VII large subunit [Clostridiales bacterium]